MSDYDPFAGLPFAKKPSQATPSAASSTPKSTAPNLLTYQACSVLLVVAAVLLWVLLHRPDFAILAAILTPFAAIAGHRQYQSAVIRHELNERFTVQLGLPTNQAGRLVHRLEIHRPPAPVADTDEEATEPAPRGRRQRTLRKLTVRYPNRVRREMLGDLKPYAQLVSDMFDGIAITAQLDPKKRVLTFAPAAAAKPEDKQLERIRSVVTQTFRDALDVQVQGLEGDRFEKATITFGPVGANIASTQNGRTRLLNLVQSRLNRDLKARWDLGKDRAVLQPRSPFPKMLLNTPERWPERIDSHAAYKAMRIPFGVDEDGNLMEWMPSVIPHGLVIGGTGSGKTACLHTVTAFVSRYFNTWILDGKNTEFVGFRDWPNVEYIAQGPEQQAWMIAGLHRLMLWRNAQIEAGLMKVEDFEPLFVIIDEYASFREAVKAWWAKVKVKGDPTQPPFLDYVGNLGRLARTAKIHMLIGIQRPDTTLLPGELRDNLMFRVSLGNLGADGSIMCWGNPITGVEPRGGARARGRGVCGRGTESMPPSEFLGFYTPDPKSDLSDDEQAQLEALKAPVNRYPRRVLRPPEPTSTEEGDIVLPTWRDWEAAKRVLADSPEGQQIIAEARAKAAAATPGLDEDETLIPAPNGASSEFALEYAPQPVPAAEATVADEVASWEAEMVSIETVQPEEYIEIDGVTYAVLDIDPFTDPDTVVVTAAPVADSAGVDQIAFEPGEIVTRHTNPNRYAEDVTA